DHLLRQARNSTIPFGGIQIIMFGDLFQLPPVISDKELHKYFEDNHGGYFFFNAHVWLNTHFKIHELTNIFRQKDQDFKIILNAIREGTVTTDQLDILNQRAMIDIPNNGVIILAPTNAAVSFINNKRLNEIEGNVHEYKAVISGHLEQSSFPTEEILRLKKGAQVMLLKNDREKRWVNGTLGYIHSLTTTEINVNIDGIVYSIPQETWKKISYYYDQSTKSIEEEVVSSFTQFPLRLAWAITIHKSQGQTYNSIAIDMGTGAFAHGQTYVALSRCTSLSGMYLKRQIMREDIIVEPRIISFMKKPRS
ncbi:MAG: ATP-dependent DNA helicase, partial [Candidatus Levyibacteriota bacterium]